MKKENILVMALIGIAFTSVMIHNHIKEGRAGVSVREATSEVSPDDGGIRWEEYARGMEQAKKLNKHILLYFHAEWCTYCKKMEATTFRDKKVQAHLNENFISIQIDTDKENEISEQWKVRGLPTVWFLKPDGTRIDNLPGYVDGDYLSKVLNYIQSEKYETMKFTEFMETTKE